MVDGSECYCYCCCCLLLRPTLDDDDCEILQSQGRCHLSYRTVKWWSVESSWKHENSTKQKSN